MLRCVRLRAVVCLGATQAVSGFLFLFSHALAAVASALWHIIFSELVAHGLCCAPNCFFLQRGEPPVDNC